MDVANPEVLPAAKRSWLFTEHGEARGYIQPHGLKELWFHTGTACNLACPFCLEGSKPGDNRLGAMRIDEVRPFIDEALELGVEQFSFTGGEPFVVRDFISILAYAARHRPCLVLTNGTAPLRRRLDKIAALREAPYPVSFRVSLDHYDPLIHDAGRGAGSFAEALQGIRELLALGFDVSLARQMQPGEDTDGIDARYHALARELGFQVPPKIVAFPEFKTPFSTADTPEITEHCMTTYQSEAGRRDFMCAFSKMVVKRDGRLRVYACTLVDDDADYDFGGSLKEAMAVRVMLRHHRCYSCFAYGASCSER